MRNIFPLLSGNEKLKALLGAHIAGAHATDLIAEVALALHMGASVRDIASTIHAHPTLAEGLYEAALSLADRSTGASHENA